MIMTMMALKSWVGIYIQNIDNERCLLLWGCVKGIPYKVSEIYVKDRWHGLPVDMITERMNIQNKTDQQSLLRNRPTLDK